MDMLSHISLSDLDLARGSLLRVRLLRLGTEEHHSLSMQAR